MKKDKTEKIEFSKKLLIQESMLIWIVTLAFIVLAFVCIHNQYFGELPWITAMAACPWGAYAVGQGFITAKLKKKIQKAALNMPHYYDSYKQMIVTLQ